MERGPAARTLSWLLIPATAALVISALSLTRTGYTGITPRGVEVAAVAPNSPGARAGLRPGDRLRLPATQRTRGTMGVDPIGSATPGRPLLLLRERDGVTTSVWIAPEPLPDIERRFRAVMFAVSSAFLLLGGWVWNERRDRLTRVFLLLSLAFAALFAPHPHLPSAGWATLHDAIYLAAQALLPALFAHFFVLFPEPRERPRAGAFVRILYAGSIAIILSFLAVEAEARYGPGAWSGMIPALTAAAGVWVAIGLVGGLLLFAASFARTPAGDARRRLRVAFFGTVIGALPLIILVVVRNVSPGTPTPLERWSIPFTVLVPASFAWAIAVHRVFDFRVALRAVSALTVAALAAVLLAMAGEYLAASWWPELGSGVTGVSLALLALVAALAGPAKPWLSALGTRLVPIADEVSLAGWLPSPETTRAADPQALFAEACATVMQALRLDGVTAVRFGAGPARAVAHAGARRTPPLGAGFADVVVRQGGPRELAELDLAHEDRDALEMAGVHWTVAVPGSPPAGALLLGRRMAGGWLDRGEARDLERLADHLGVALENLELKHQVRSRDALHRELAEARQVQMHRLPRRTPVYPTLDCAAAALSVEPVGGDHYDFIEGGPRDFTLAVGDAAGHGVPAAIVLAGVQSRFRDEAQRARHPGELLEALNRDLVALEQPEKFVAMLCARVDAAAGTLRFANAGQIPPIVRRAAGGFELHDESGLLLGVSPQARYRVSEVELGSGDVVVMCTDGLTEASRAGEMFGTEGIVRVLDQSAHRRASDILEELLAAVRAWADEPLDDVTIVVLKQLTRPTGRVRPALSALKSSA